MTVRVQEMPKEMGYRKMKEAKKLLEEVRAAKKQKETKREKVQSKSGRER